MNRKIGCLIIHGFGGNTGEIFPLAEFLAQKGFKIFCPALKGHTGKRSDMAKFAYTDWIESAEDELLRLNMQCERVVLIGFSMGGLIAANLARKYKTYGLVTLNTPIYYWDFKRVGLNLLDDIKAMKFSNLMRYLKAVFMSPLAALINFRRILAKTKPLLHEVKCPIFIAQALKDDTTHFRSADHIYRNTGSQKKLIKYYENSGHQICLSEDCEELFNDVLDFIEKTLSAK